MGYYNSGFTSGGLLRGLGSAVSLAGNVAAAVLPALYLHHSAEATQAPAAGPTHPVMRAAGSGVVPTTAMGRAEQAALHPIDTALQELGLRHPAMRRGRYAAPGTKGFHAPKRANTQGLWVRNRHRNVANIHALRRSLSRIHGFEKICRKVVHFVHPKRAVGHAVFKRRKRS